MTRSLVRGIAAVALVLGATACASSGAGNGTGGGTSPHSPTASAVSTASTVTLIRTGGIAGNNDRVVIDPNGAWVRTGRLGKFAHGQLTPAQLIELRGLIADPALATPPPSSGTLNCADGYRYMLSVGTERVAYSDCDTTKPTTAAKISGLVMTWTTAPS